jgi:hypothetical protein
MTPRLQTHRDKIIDLIDLCKQVTDLKVQAFLARSLVILASSYIELAVREVVGEFCRQRSAPAIANFVRVAISSENSLNCRKIESILGRLGLDFQSRLRPLLGDEEQAAIDSLKALRDQIAHGGDNNTGYIVITRYFKAVENFPIHLQQALSTL